jgi:restriction system protein
MVKAKKNIPKSGSEITLWGIHAGRTGDASQLFLNEKLVGLGWERIQDLSKVPATREAFREIVLNAYPERPSAVPNNAGQLFRFIHEMKKNDWIVFPNRLTRQIHIGQIISDYIYNPKKSDSYPHQRSVKWLRSPFSRTQFSQGALHEIGSAMSFFQVRNYADEFKAAIAGEKISSPPIVTDESIAIVSEDTEETTKDFILKTLAQDLKGNALEGFVKHLLECMGYHVRFTRKNEPAVDLIAHRDHLGLEPPIIKVQVKSGEGTVSHNDVSALNGILSDREFGLFVALGSYSTESRRYEINRPNFRLIDGEELVNLILEHYENFDSRHKGIIPLRRMYVPEPLN